MRARPDSRAERTFNHAAYGVGQIGEGIENTSLELFVVVEHVQVLGLSGTLACLATFLALLVDAVTHPLAVLHGPGILALALLALVFLRGYRIDRARHAEILRALEARRSGTSRD